MSTDLALSEGICQRLNSADKDDESLWNSKPALQFLSIKKAMLATQLNHLVEEDRICKNTVAVIENMSCQYILEKRLVIILALRVLQRDAPKIGNPAPLTTPPPQPMPDAESAPGAPAPPVSSSVAPQPQSRQAGSRANPIYPIVALTPYQNNWRIKARVVQKSEIRHYSNQRGEGRFFSVTLMDDSGEIKATIWNAMVDELCEKLQEHRVYFVSKARLSLDRGTDIEECHDVDVPVIRYNFTNIKGLQEYQAEAVCDVIVAVKDVGDLAEITTRNNKTTQKRDLTVVDDTEFSIRLTLWGKQAEQFSAPLGTVIAFKGVRVSEFNGNSGSIVINPDIQEAHFLKGWYMDGGAQASFNSHTQAGLSSGPGGAINRSEMRTIDDVKVAQLGMSDKPDFFAIRATIMHIKTDNITYPACPTPQCNKKVMETHDGWRCEKCDRSHEKPEYRYILQMAVGDHTGQIWLSGFNDIGNTLFGLTGNELHSLQQEDETKANHIVQQATCNMYSFACRAAQQSFNDQNRVRYGIQKIQPLDYVVESRALIELLRSPWAQ
ncbi:replication factor-a protein [Russula brevipes]|nr:replication factor-a protein [Russula brevipes]